MATDKRQPTEQRPIECSDAIVRALLLIPQHPQVVEISAPLQTADGGVEVDVTFRVNLPNRWKGDGKSPNGVRSEEILRFLFPMTYPLDAPYLSLRPDFDRSHPHVMPQLYGERPMPCIAEISLDSLLHQQGLRGILNQSAIWLDNAALGTLIDPVQGWEPIRRDDLPHSITADAEWLRQKVTREGGHFYFPFAHVTFSLVRGGKGVRGCLVRQPITLNAATIGNHIDVMNAGPLSIGRSLALLVWPGKKPDGSPFVCSEYRPEDVKTFADLVKRARDYGCQRTLSEQLGWLRQCAGSRIPGPEVPIAIILCVRRPIHLIGSESAIEIIGYITKYCDLVRSNWQDLPVESAAHNHELGVELCRTLSGVGELAGRWTLIGAGSIGSKIALHLARQGMAPSHVVDSGIMRAHNSIRHGLMPQAQPAQMAFTGYKATLLCEAIAAFSQRAAPTYGDAAECLRVPAVRRQIIPRGTIALVNSAASIRVREAIAALSPSEMSAPVVETSLFSDGRVGLITFEGPDRTPNTGDLISEFYRIAAATPFLQRVLFDGGKDLARVGIGEGCGSATMVLSDAKLSAYAAAMAQILSDKLEMSHPQGGGISIGVSGEDGISLTWTHNAAPNVQVFPAANLPGWTVRLSNRVEAAILADISLWPDVETGGILMGRMSEISRTFYIVDILAAPPDSQRSAACFSLGVIGLQSALKEYSERHGWSLYCLGTWHNHLGSGDPSGLDKQTARSVALARIAPSLLLIKSPGGYSALVADAASI
jgi:hypothetical protein